MKAQSRGAFLVTVLALFLILLFPNDSRALNSQTPTPSLCPGEQTPEDLAGRPSSLRGVSIVEVEGVPGSLSVHWLVPPAGKTLPGVAVVSPSISRRLTSSGAAVRVLAPYDRTRLYYLVTTRPLLSESSISETGQILWQAGENYLLSVEAGSEDRLVGLRCKVIPLRPILFTPERTAAGPAPRIYDQPENIHFSTGERFWIERMVSSVSEQNLLRDVSCLSGAAPMNLSTGQHTIRSRYVKHPDCLKAAEYLYSQFEGMGLDVKYERFLGTPVRGLTFIGDRGYVLGSKGLIYHTEDGGVTWERQVSGVNKNLWRSCFVSPDTGWIVGMFGTVLKTSDGGAAWTDVGEGLRRSLYGVDFLDSSTGWVCGDRGLIYRTDNGGLTWTQQSVRTTEDDRLYGVDFVDRFNGWVVGVYGTALHTPDGGLNWEFQDTRVGDDLYDVCFSDSRNGWAVGWWGTILHTSDGGASWELQESGVRDELTSVCFVDSLRGWVVGDRGVILTTSDGGANWTPKIPGIGADLHSVFFADSSRGWVAGAVSIMGTSDGGTSWFPLNEGIPDNWANVVATLPGTQTPSKKYVVCGHYDSMSEHPTLCAPGADDNASGTSLVLEAARILKDFGFESTVEFICLTAEELAYWSGSRYYASCARMRGEDIAATLNFDMVAWGSHALYLIGNNASSWLVDYCAAIGDDFVPGLPLTKLIDSNWNLSDHASFWAYDYSAFCGIELDHWDNPNWHTCHDLVRTLSMPLATDVTRLAVASLASMARLSTVPKVAAVVDLDPETLNLKSRGQHVTCHIELPHEHQVSGIDISTVVMNGEVRAEAEPCATGDYDSDGIPDLTLKFPRGQVQQVLAAGERVEVKVAGRVGEFEFEGKDTIRVIGEQDYYVSADAAGGAEPTNERVRPLSYRLLQNYPQPFNPATTIQYELPVASQVRLRVFDVAGKLVRTLVNEQRPAGVHSVVWQGENESGHPVTSGVYVYVIKAGDYTETRKMILLR